jgi:hypothetical protein
MNIDRLKWVTLGMLVLGAMTLWANGAKADQVVYSQPLQSPLVDAGGLYTPTGNFQTADSFTLAQGASIDSLQWFGSYENGDAVGFPAATATDFFVVLGTCVDSNCLSDLSDVGDIPGVPIMEFSPSMAHETFLGTSSNLNLAGFIPSNASNYSYQVNFTVPIQLSSGEYYLTILPKLAPGDADWSFDAGTGGDGISQGLNPTLKDNFDLAFTLNGTPTTANVPEPSSVLLLGIGLGIVCLLARGARRLISPVCVLVLLGLACLPVATRADTFTLDGASIDSFAVNTNLNTLSVQMATADALPYQTDLIMGTKISALILDEFAIVDGILTLENEFEFRGDFVKSFQFETGSDMLISNVTFTYGDVKSTGAGGSGGDGTTMPEPSSMPLLASGLLGLIGFGRKKHASARGAGRAGWCQL